MGHSTKYHSGYRYDARFLRQELDTAKMCIFGYATVTNTKVRENFLTKQGKKPSKERPVRERKPCRKGTEPLTGILMLPIIISARLAVSNGRVKLLVKVSLKVIAHFKLNAPLQYWAMLVYSRGRLID